MKNRKMKNENNINIDQAIHIVSDILINSVQEATKGIDNLSVSFSGGIDSSLLVYLVQNYTSVKEISLITTCFPGTYDVGNAKHSATLLGLKPEFYFLDRNILFEGMAGLSEVIGTLNPVVISYMLPLFFVCKNAKDRYVLLGQGSDELFGGYHWQQNLSEEDFIKKTERTVRKLVKEVDVREEKIGKYFQKELLMPYLNKILINFVLPLPKDLRAGRKEKFLLRLVADKLGLPIDIVQKKKKAAQYGSGIMREMKKIKDKSNLEWD